MFNECLHYDHPNCKLKETRCSVCPFYHEGDMNLYVDYCKFYKDSGGYAVFRGDIQVSKWFENKWKAVKFRSEMMNAHEYEIVARCELL